MDQDTQEKDSCGTMTGLVLETICTCCGGVTGGGCNQCCGSGFQPTSDGYKVLALIEHHFSELLIEDGIARDMIAEHNA